MVPSKVPEPVLRPQALAAPDGRADGWDEGEADESVYSSSKNLQPIIGHASPRGEDFH